LGQFGSGNQKLEFLGGSQLRRIIKKKARERKNAVGGDQIQEAEFEEEMEKDSER